MKDEGLGGTMGLFILGAVVVGVVWTAITGQCLHWLAIGLGIWVIGRAGRDVSKH